jgi:hypothetical protein
MTRRWYLVTTLILAAVAVAPTAATPQAGQWTTLFDGTSLQGWNRVGDANWTLSDGAVQADSGSGFLVTPAAYGDFQLTIDFWVSDVANSGVFIRCADPQTITDMNAYEINIFDTRPDQTYRTGGIVHLAAPKSVVMTGGKWNVLDITARGTKLSVILNGLPMAEADDAKLARGPIALQYGAGTVRFRNVRIRTF